MFATVGAPMTRLNWDRERRLRPLRENREPNLGPDYPAAERGPYDNAASTSAGKRSPSAEEGRHVACPPPELRIAADPDVLSRAAAYRVVARDWPSFHRWVLERLRGYDGAVVCAAQRRLAVAGFVPKAGDLLALHKPHLDEQILHLLGFSEEPRYPFSGHWWTLVLPPPASHSYRDIAAVVPQALAVSSPRGIRWTFGQLSRPWI